MSPIEKLLLETVPTRPDPAVRNRPWTQEEQDAHWEALADAIGCPNSPRPTRPAEEPDPCPAS
ncbi:hypothetical protein EDD90_2826 [Streptomyces sp. Ag109_O5-1]|uniref:hypothetical protein n=1 Tax=Streptomyces sp. Ag109_O5-1 TaxID=1938851 RepID=UPI000F4DF4E0|nr:hypothetical protein [Streptomyces sp. Ag109_O5-1]RPE39808.1 hypothetical protein EDD90_2826 [Streptomyces sp. Ag109_O5-1]